MKIITWNLHIKNKYQKDNLEVLIKEETPDIICLQEVSKENKKFLEKLKGYHTLFCEEKISFKKKPTLLENLAILSKYKIKNFKIIKHKVFEDFRSTKRKKFKRHSIESSYIDVEIKKKKIRIFNVHLEFVASPKYRVEQLKYIYSNKDSKSINILCGDFNSFGRMYTNLFFFLLGNISFKEIKDNEKKILNKYFNKNKLMNIFEKSKTFMWHNLQLDYILIPKNIKVSFKKNLNRKNSDHKPLLIEVNI